MKLFFLLVALALLQCICAYSVDLDEPLQARIGEFVRSVREKKDQVAAVGADAEPVLGAAGGTRKQFQDEYDRLEGLLKDILKEDGRAADILDSLTAEDTAAAAAKAEAATADAAAAAAVKEKNEIKEAQVSVDGNMDLPPPPCEAHLSCDECVSNRCGWCILSRVCRPDRAWECQGDIDHVGLGGVGRHTTCPSLEEIDKKRQEKKQRRIEAEAERVAEQLAREKAAAADAAKDGKGDDEDVVEDNKKKKKDRAESKIDRFNLLKKRSELAAETVGYGKLYPYETLALPPTCSTADIKKAYRRLSVQLHPDKNPDMQTMAGLAFKDLVDAHEMLSDPQKRAMFDETGAGEAHESFDSQDAYEKYGKENKSNFYGGDKFISPLTKALWERRVGTSNNVWIVEFYAPWCSHCQQMIPMYKEAAEELSEDTHIEVGAVNCESQPDLCAEYGINSYPTIIALNEKWQTRQELQSKQPKTVASIASFARSVTKEWRYLFNTADVTHINNSTHFIDTVTNSTEFWVVAFMDGLDCSSCKTAKTNCMRLSASLRGYPAVKVGIVDCEDTDNRQLCYEQMKLPARPHAPIVKGFPSGEKTENSGETMYNANEVEPHVALQMLDATIRLAMADSVDTSAVGVASDGGGFKSEDKDEDEDEDEDDWEVPPEPLWNGPMRRTALPWNQPGGAAPNRPRIGA